MGSAEVQGELWGAKARDWAQVQEPAWRPAYDALLAQCRIGPGIQLLDVGCGAGGALVAARERGAQVCGLDAAAALVDVARTRLPGARIEVGEMEALPFDAGAFDIITSFNAFQFAADAGKALGEARRVCRARGVVAMLVWGRKEHCDLINATMPAVFALLPAPSVPAAVSIAYAERGVIESLMRNAGLAPSASGEITCEFVYRDAAMAWRAIAAAAPAVRAVRHSGEDAVKRAVLGTLVPFTRPDGSVRQTNRFRWVTATPG